MVADDPREPLYAADLREPLVLRWLERQATAAARRIMEEEEWQEVGDVAQEALTRILRRFAATTEPIDHPKAYVRTTVSSVWRDHLRRLYRADEHGESYRRQMETIDDPAVGAEAAGVLGSVDLLAERHGDLPGELTDRLERLRAARFSTADDVNSAVVAALVAIFDARGIVAVDGEQLGPRGLYETVVEALTAAMADPAETDAAARKRAQRAGRPDRVLRELHKQLRGREEGDEQQDKPYRRPGLSSLLVEGALAEAGKEDRARREAQAAAKADQRAKSAAADAGGLAQQDPVSASDAEDEGRRGRV